MSGRYSRCTASGCREVIMLCLEGWEHLDASGRPVGKWKTSPGPPAGGVGTPARVGHPAMPTLNDNGEVVFVTKTGRRPL